MNSWLTISIFLAGLAFQAGLLIARLRAIERRLDRLESLFQQKLTGNPQFFHRLIVREMAGE